VQLRDDVGQRVVALTVARGTAAAAKADGLDATGARVAAHGKRGAAEADAHRLVNDLCARTRSARVRRHGPDVLT
jgi:hypothetical protein